MYHAHRCYRLVSVKKQTEQTSLPLSQSEALLTDDSLEVFSSGSQDSLTAVETSLESR